MITVFMRWMPFAIISTGLCVLVYATVQQNYRQSLNDPQIQMAEDAAVELQGGADLSSVVPAEKINIGQSLAPWLAVYDSNGRALASSGFLNTAMPQPPIGVFAAADKFSSGCEGAGPFESSGWRGCNSAENRLTWQPQPDVRQAIVVIAVPQKKQYVVAGRNMREVEKREGQLSLYVTVVWIAALFSTLVWIWLVRRLERV